VLRCLRDHLLNGEIVRISFVIDAHDREVLAWHAVAGAGVSGSMVRDLMLEAVELRFATIQAPHAVEWLSDNGSPFTAKETLDFAAALGLVPCFTPARSPESNGIAEAFLKTFKRDYARIHPDRASRKKPRASRPTGACSRRKEPSENEGVICKMLGGELLCACHHCEWINLNRRRSGAGSRV
jgi:transposase InsO family protein